VCDGITKLGSVGLAAERETPDPARWGPPDLQDAAAQNVLPQAEALSNDWVAAWLKLDLPSSTRPRFLIMRSTSSQPKFVCHRCIGDAYLKDEISKMGKLHKCIICMKRRKAIPFEELCQRVHVIVSEEYVATSDDWDEREWRRDGEDIDSVLYEVLEVDGALIDAVKAHLSDLHYTYEEAQIGEEDPYGDAAHYVPRQANDFNLHGAWSEFEAEIRTRARFFSKTAESILDDIFGELNRFRARKRSLIRDVGPSTSTNVIFRARRASDHAAITKILEHPARELGAPPMASAGSGRMNPRWISMFYGAFDADTCVAEIRAPVGSSVVIGQFQIARPLRLLDLHTFKELFVERASFFDPDFRRLREKARFLGHLVEIMSRPVMPNDEDFQYLPTQAVAEYLSEKVRPKLDGLIFPSSQRGGKGENVVLFRRSAGAKSDGTQKLTSEVQFGWQAEDDYDRDITVWTKPKKKKKASLGNSFDLSEPEHLSDEESALRIDLDSLEVRDIKGVTYNTETRRVRRYKQRTSKVPF